MKREMGGADDIRRVVDLFYEGASKDELLAPIFLQVGDPSAEREMLYRYWESVILESDGSDSTMFPDHIRLMFSRRHFVRWLRLFMEAVDVLYSGPLAEQTKYLLIKKSEQFQMKLALSGV